MLDSDKENIIVKKKNLLLRIKNINFKRTIVIILILFLTICTLCFLIPIYIETIQDKPIYMNNFDIMQSISIDNAITIEGSILIESGLHLYINFHCYKYFSPNDSAYASLETTYEKNSLGYFESDLQHNEIVYVTIIENELFIRLAFINEDFNLKNYPLTLLSISVFSSIFDNSTFEMYNFSLNSIYVKEPDLLDMVTFNNQTDFFYILINEFLFVQKGELILVLIPSKLYELEKMFIPIIFMFSIFLYVLPSNIILVRTKKEIMKWSYSIFLVSIILANFKASFYLHLLLTLPASILGIMALISSYLFEKKHLSQKKCSVILVILWIINSMIFHILYKGFFNLMPFYYISLSFLLFFISNSDS